jgi:hypothetical protein
MDNDSNLNLSTFSDGKQPRREKFRKKRRNHSFLGKWFLAARLLLINNAYILGLRPSDMPRAPTYVCGDL